MCILLFFLLGGATGAGAGTVTGEGMEAECSLLVTVTTPRECFRLLALVLAITSGSAMPITNIKKNSIKLL